MTYVAPSSRSTGTLITAAIWNQDIVDNVAALKTPPTDLIEVDNNANYTTASATFVDVSATNLIVDVTTTGGDILIGFDGVVGTDAAGKYGYLDVYHIEGTARIGAGTDGITRWGRGDAAQIIGMSFARLVQGLAAGQHQFKLQWKVTTGGNIYLYAGDGVAGQDHIPQFWAKEV